MKIYTKTGDSGDTGLGGGTRVKKHHPRIVAYGTIDELNAVLGIALCQVKVTTHAQLLTTIQSQLFSIGSVLANPQQSTAVAQDDMAKIPEKSRLSTAAIQVLEAAIDDDEKLLKPLRSFILPGGSLAAAQLHLARTVCRRAERCLVALAESEVVAPIYIIYLNRLSDLLFVMARLENQQQGIADIPW